MLPDVYLYWLAVVAQLHDLFIRDNKLATPKYGLALKEKIRAIVNCRFGQLISMSVLRIRNLQIC